MRLLPKNFNRLQKAIFALHECLTLTAFKKALPVILMGLVPSDLFYAAEFDLELKAEREKITATADSPPPEKPVPTRFIENFWREHPAASLLAPPPGAAVLKLADFYSLPRLRGKEFYERYYEPDGGRRMLAIATQAGPQTLGVIGLCNRATAFTERDRRLLKLIGPHIEQTRRHLAMLAPGKPVHAEVLTAYGLTPREAEITHWLVSGKTNAEIAAILTSCTRTVEKHMEAILKKLGAENRAAAAALLAAQAEPATAWEIRASA